MGPALSQALEQILGLAVSHLPRSLEVAQLQPACLDEMLKDIVHGDWMSRLLSKPACDPVQLFVNVLADPYCSHCRQRHNVTSAIKGVLSLAVTIQELGKAIKSCSARNHFATTWADSGVTMDHGRTVRTQLKIATFDMFLVENFRRFLRQVIISLGEGVLSRRSRIVRCLSPFFVPGWRWDEAKSGNQSLQSIEHACLLRN